MPYGFVGRYQSADSFDCLNIVGHIMPQDNITVLGLFQNTLCACDGINARFPVLAVDSVDECQSDCFMQKRTYIEPVFCKLTYN